MSKCMDCGSEIDTGGDNLRCSRCKLKQQKPIQGMPGWVCPVCGDGINPHNHFKGESFLIFIFNKSADFKKSIGKPIGEPLTPGEHNQFTKYLQNLSTATRIIQED